MQSTGNRVIKQDIYKVTFVFGNKYSPYALYFVGMPDGPEVLAALHSEAGCDSALELMQFGLPFFVPGCVARRPCVFAGVRVGTIELECQGPVYITGDSK